MGGLGRTRTVWHSKQSKHRLLSRKSNNESRKRNKRTEQHRNKTAQSRYGRGGKGMKITRNYLESLVGKKITVKFFDNQIITGVLKLGNGFFYEPKKYTINGVCFRLSHLKKIEEVIV